jgi:hypothetical protein
LTEMCHGEVPWIWWLKIGIPWDINGKYWDIIKLVGLDSSNVRLIAGFEWDHLLQKKRGCCWMIIPCSAEESWWSESPNLGYLIWLNPESRPKYDEYPTPNKLVGMLQEQILSCLQLPVIKRGWKIPLRWSSHVTLPTGLYREITTNRTNLSFAPSTTPYRGAR